MADPLAELTKGAGDEGESSGVDAARDLIAAVKSGDARAADLALQRHYETCASEPDEYGPDSEEAPTTKAPKYRA